MHVIQHYPGYPLGAVAHPFAVRLDDGKTFVKVKDQSGGHIYETAGRINGNYPIRRELTVADGIEYTHVRVLFDMPYEDYLNFGGFHPNNPTPAEKRAA